MRNKKIIFAILSLFMGAIAVIISIAVFPKGGNIGFPIAFIAIFGICFIFFVYYYFKDRHFYLPNKFEEVIARNTDLVALDVFDSVKLHYPYFKKKQPFKFNPLIFDRLHRACPHNNVNTEVLQPVANALWEYISEGSPNTPKVMFVDSNPHGHIIKSNYDKREIYIHAEKDLNEYTYICALVREEIKLYQHDLGADYTSMLGRAETDALTVFYGFIDLFLHIKKNGYYLNGFKAQQTTTGFITYLEEGDYCKIANLLKHDFRFDEFLHQVSITSIKDRNVKLLRNGLEYWKTSLSLNKPIILSYLRDEGLARLHEEDIDAYNLFFARITTFKKLGEEIDALEKDYSQSKFLEIRRHYAEGYLLIGRIRRDPSRK